MSQDVLASLICIDNVVLEVTDQFMCQVSTITSNLMLGLEIDKHHQSSSGEGQFQDKSQLILCTKLKVFQSCLVLHIMAVNPG